MIWDEALVLTVNQKWKNCYFKISSTAILHLLLFIGSRNIQHHVKQH